MWRRWRKQRNLLFIVNAHSVNAHSVNAHSVNAHSVNTHSVNTHSVNTHSVNTHSGTTSNTGANSHPNSKPRTRTFRTISRRASDCRQQPSTYCPRAILQQQHVE